MIDYLYSILSHPFKIIPQDFRTLESPQTTQYWETVNTIKCNWEKRANPTAPEKPNDSCLMSNHGWRHKVKRYIVFEDIHI